MKDRKVKRKFLRLCLLFSCLLMMLGGCGTQYKYANYKNMESPIYAATSFDVDFIGEALFGQDDSMLSPRSLRILIPLFIVDLPFAVAIDTITFPYDWHIYSRNKKKIAPSAVNAKDTSLEAENFNPTPNDRNIEYDPAENLFDKVKFRGMQP